MSRPPAPGCARGGLRALAATIALLSLLGIACAQAAASTPAVIIGVNDGTGWGEPDSNHFKEYGLRSERIDGTGTALNYSLAQGWTNDVVIVGNVNDEEPLGHVNISKWTEETLAEVKEAALKHVTLLEVGNEMFLKGPRCSGCYQQKEPVKYAEMFISLSKAVETAKVEGVKLLFNSYGDYRESEHGGWSQVQGGRGWLGDAEKAEPELRQRVAAFTMHPYGEAGQNKENDWGPVALKVEHEQAVALGFEHTDTYATEFGVELEQAGANGSTSPKNQAERIRAVYSELISYPYVKGIWYYQTHDDHTGKGGTWGLIEPQKEGGSPFVPRPSLEVVSEFAKLYTAPTPELVEFKLQIPYESEEFQPRPTDITKAPDGNVWYTEPTPSAIGKITPAGAVTEFNTHSGGAPTGIALGSDENLWFTEEATSYIGKITTAGVITYYKLPEAAHPSEIALGPDGNLWFTEPTNDKIGKITTSGTITEYPLGTERSPHFIAKGPDGNVWFTEYHAGAYKVVKMTTSGTVSAEYEGLEGQLVSGPGGDMWIGAGDGIEKMTTSGAATYYPLGKKYENANHITVGPEGNLWFTGTQLFGKMTPSGAVTEYELAELSFPKGVTVGGDGNIWFAEGGGARGSHIGRVIPAAEGKAPQAFVRAALTATRPVNTSAPTITATPRQDEPTPEVHGSWTNEPTSYSYQWLKCNSGGSECAAISGATEAEYRPAAADIGHTLKVEEGATNSGGTTGPVTSSASAVVLRAAPANTVLPAVSGAVQQGQVLSASSGSWANEPTSYGYQWERCNASGGECSNISGATSSTYTLAEVDLEHTLAVKVTATNAGGSGSATSAVTAQVQGLLVGDATTSYSVADQTTVGREEAFQFTAKITGKIEELEFRTDATANPGITGVVLGVFAESSGKPGSVLGQATVSGEPATSSWIKASGLSINVVSGTKYWLLVLPLGTSGKQLHFDAAASSGGTGNVESVAGGLSSLTAESSWETYNQGPAGFQAIGP